MSAAIDKALALFGFGLACGLAFNMWLASLPCEVCQ